MLVKGFIEAFKRPCKGLLRAVLQKSSAVVVGWQLSETALPPMSSTRPPGLVANICVLAVVLQSLAVGLQVTRNLRVQGSLPLKTQNESISGRLDVHIGKPGWPTPRGSLNVTASAGRIVDVTLILSPEHQPIVPVRTVGSLITDSNDGKKLNGMVINNFKAISECHERIWPGQPVPQVIQSWHKTPGNTTKVGFETHMTHWSVMISALSWASQRPRLQNNNAPANFSLMSLTKEFLKCPAVELTHYRLGDGCPIIFKPEDHDHGFPNGAVYTQDAFWYQAKPLWETLLADPRRSWFTNCNPGNPSLGHFLLFCLDPHVLAHHPDWNGYALYMIRQIGAALTFRWTHIANRPGELGNRIRVKRLKCDRHIAMQIMFDCKELCALPKDDPEKVAVEKKTFLRRVQSVCLFRFAAVVGCHSTSSNRPIGAGSTSA